MNEKNQKIIGKVIKRLLSKNYPEDLLNSLLVLEDYTIHKEFYTEEELRMYVPFLKGTGYEFKEIRRLRKELRQELVNQINVRADLDRSYYEIGILILALERVSHCSEGTKGVHTKNSRIKFCCWYSDKIEDSCNTDATMKLAMKTLKLI